MNKKRLRRLAKALEDECILDNNLPVRFDMRTWYYRYSESDIDVQNHSCGSVACIGGHADILFADEMEGFHGSSCEVLELTPTQRNLLFNPNTVNWSRITRDVAVYQLRKLIKTGDAMPDWLQTVNEHERGARLTDDDIKGLC
jgi:hypothetical protein